MRIVSKIRRLFSSKYEDLVYSKQVKEILERPYHWILMPDFNDKWEGWVAYIEEFPGCCTQGKTKEEALSMLQEAAEIWIDFLLEQPELALPEPIKDWDIEGNSINCRVRHHVKDKLVGEI